MDKKVTSDIINFWNNAYKINEDDLNYFDSINPLEYKELARSIIVFIWPDIS